jgi:hypothetical protein
MKQLRGIVVDAITKRLTASGANPLAAKLVAKRLVASLEPARMTISPLETLDQ